MIFAGRFLASHGQLTFSRMNLIKSHLAAFCCAKGSLRPLVKTDGNTVEWNFKSLDNKSCQIDLLLVLNNPNFNLPWFKLATAQASSIILVDGGANIFHSLQMGLPEQSIQKVKALIGDMDSVETEVEQFYKYRNVKIIKDTDQQKNDLEKTLIYGTKLGCKNIVISGAFGDRMDHNFGTISLAEKMMNSNHEVNMVLTNGTSIYCPLRSGFKHKISMSNLINRVGCGLITFQKIPSLETSGLKWNLGQKEMHKGIEWGKFLSTSNEIMSDEIVVESKKEDKSFVSFVAKLKDGQE